ncbi:hypothetical protein F443_01815 [Phytophthora nicotianae P1569]|uniref:Uncharacterized protein n=1 Tax=Phytophthora nicotianae P1569 TaxID=1317065 RepID=V9FXP8_PHYNI|nr:hypothetical protein F443_01815 [Phytophthora nicotianae P1569]
MTSARPDGTPGTTLRSQLWRGHAPRASPYRPPSRASFDPLQEDPLLLPDHPPTREEVATLVPRQPSLSGTDPAAVPAQAAPAVTAPVPGTEAPGAPGARETSGLVDDSVDATGSNSVSENHVATGVTEDAASAAPAAAAPPDNRYQLLVRPIVKTFINQRDSSAETLRDAVFTGRSFNAIMEAVWEMFSGRFKVKKRVVDSTKSRQEWNQWLVATRGTAVTLMIYEYGMAIASAKDRDEFMKACILPEETDRAGAATESSVRDVVAALRQKWGTAFMAASVVWSMWANDIIRNGDHSTWITDIADPPPRYVANLLSPAESRLEEHLSGLLRRLLVSAVRFVDEQEQRLAAREAVIEGVLRDMVPPSPSQIIDPLPRIENVKDTEHAE